MYKPWQLSGQRGEDPFVCYLIASVFFWLGCVYIYDAIGWFQRPNLKQQLDVSYYFYKTRKY